MRVYVMHCGACGTEMQVPGGVTHADCPGCRQTRQVTTDGNPLPLLD